ncbi:hypothetical protein [Amycolatopsis japonica]|uniref:hypothetical protein n=1 Tax=Amycolatopsis japonica TaxID=208439 RepID=UPI0034041C81
MSTLGPYHPAAFADGVWTKQLLSTAPYVAVDEIAGALAATVGRTGVPLTAYAHTTGRVATRLVLVRDPSVTHGVPDEDDCEVAAFDFVRNGPWRNDGQMARAAVLVAMGLREGYAPGNRQRTYTEFRTEHDRHRGVWVGHPAVLISARPRPDGDVQVHREAGVCSFADPEDLPVHAAIADAFGQHRFVVHNWLTGRVTAYRHEREATR